MSLAVVGDIELTVGVLALLLLRLFFKKSIGLTIPWWRPPQVLSAVGWSFKFVVIPKWIWAPLNFVILPIGVSCVTFEPLDKLVFSETCP